MVDFSISRWDYRRILSRFEMKENLPLYFAMLIATVFVGVFCVSFVYDLNNPDYDIPAGLYPLLTIIVGAIFGFVFKKSANG